MASYKLFLKEMKHLAEYRTLLEAGYEYQTTICGKSLKVMLNDYGNMVLSGKCCLCIALLYFFQLSYLIRIIGYCLVFALCYTKSELFANGACVIFVSY